MPAVTPAERHNPERYGSSKRHPPPRLAAWHAGLRAPPQAAALKWSKPPGLPCRRSRRQSDTIPNGTGVPNAIRPAGLRAPLQAAAPSGACRQACHAGGHAGRATYSRAAWTPQEPSAAKTGGVARRTARSTSSCLPLFQSPCLPSPQWSVFPVPCSQPVTTLPKSFFLSFSISCQLALSFSLDLEGERCG